MRSSATRAIPRPHMSMPGTSRAFAGKVVLVTGGTSGIGHATALAFAQAGASVVIAGRRAAEGAAAVEAIERDGGIGRFVQADVSVEADVAAAVATTVERFGRLDVAFNNAGVFLESGPITEITAELIDRTLGTNLRGVALCLKHEIAAMPAAGGGAIVNTASFPALRPMAGSAVYNASKAPVVGLTRTAALEFATRNVRVDAVCPGVVETAVNADSGTDEQGSAALAGMQPVGRIGRPEEIAAAVLYLCSDQASFTTGTALSVDDAITV